MRPYERVKLELVADTNGSAELVGVANCRARVHVFVAEVGATQRRASVRIGRVQVEHAQARTAAVLSIGQVEVRVGPLRQSVVGPYH